MVVQAVADGEKRFLDVAAGFPGNMHDSRVLRNSSLYRRIANNELLLGLTVRVDGRDITPVLFGDSAYPLSTWLLKPYHEGTNECAFGSVLSGYWKDVGEFFKNNLTVILHLLIRS